MFLKENIHAFALEASQAACARASNGVLTDEAFPSWMVSGASETDVFRKATASLCHPGPISGVAWTSECCRQTPS